MDDAPKLTDTEREALLDRIKNPIRDRDTRNDPTPQEIAAVDAQLGKLEI